MGPARAVAPSAPSSVRALVGHGFERLGLHRVQPGAYGDDPRAPHVHEKVGLVVEGVRREAAFRGGERVDEVLMSILDRAWAALSATGR